MGNLILIFISAMLLAILAVYKIAKAFKLKAPIGACDDEMTELILTAAYWEKKAQGAYNATDIMQYQKLATIANQKALSLNMGYLPRQDNEKSSSDTVVRLSDYK